MEPPTAATLAEVRALAQKQKQDIDHVQSAIADAEAELAALVARTRQAIDAMIERKRALEDDLMKTRAYTSPIRRLPAEMLREVFSWVFENDPRGPWGLSAVCRSWRATALAMPRLWSKIHFSTAQIASADVVRLWLERAGSSPLDVEIFIESENAQTPSPSHNLWIPFHGGWVAAHQAIPGPNADPTSMHWAHIVTFYLVARIAQWRRFVLRFDRHFPSMDALQSISGDAPLLEEFEMCTADTAYFPTDWRPFMPCSVGHLNLPRLRSVNLHHIAFGLMSPLLVKSPSHDEQVTSLTSITLRALPGTIVPLNQVIALVMSNPLLESLVLYFPSLQPPVLPLSSYAPITLSELRTLALGGRAILTHLVDKLVTPCLRHFAWDIDTRSPERTTVRHVLERLLKRSGPAAGTLIEKISLGYGFPYPPSHPFRIPSTATFEDAGLDGRLSPYAQPPLIGGLRRLLRLTPNLHTLNIAEVPLDLVFGVLGGFGDMDMDDAATDDEDEDTIMLNTSFTGWTSPAWAAPASDDGAGVNGLGGAGPQVGGAHVCPRLARLALRTCGSVHPQEALRRMVGFVQGRNPGGVAQAAFTHGKPARLEELEMVGCARLEPDIGIWLESRVPTFVCRGNEPGSRSGSPFSSPSP